MGKIMVNGLLAGCPDVAQRAVAISERHAVVDAEER